MDEDMFFLGESVPQEPAVAPTAGGSIGSEVPVEQLIPPIVLKELNLQSHLSGAVFGYDIRHMQDRPWAAPGAVQSDYFNYGFNERSWRIFCAMQAEGTDSLVQRAEEFFQRIEGIAAAPPQQHSMHSMMDGSYGQAYPGQRPPFSGPGFGMPPGAGGPGGAGGMGQREFFKTKLCQRYQEGRCTRGATCNYAHGAQELRSVPQFNAPQQGAPGGGAMQQQQPPMPARSPYPMPPSQDGPGILSMPPMGSYPMQHSPGMPMPMPPHGGGFDAPTGFRMPMKRDRSDDQEGVFEPVLK